MSLQDKIKDFDPSAHVVRVDAQTLLHGSLRTTEEEDGWVRPWRITADQMRALGSCRAWHPGLFRQMARTTTGINLEFETDSFEILLEVKLDEEPTGTRSVLKYVDGLHSEITWPHDGISIDIDGVHLKPRFPVAGANKLSLVLDTQEPVREDVEDAAHACDARHENEDVCEPLVHHVRIWLPSLRGACIRTLFGDGTYIKGVPARKQLLVLGDSIAQGFVCEDPAYNWCSQIAHSLDLDVVNQGLGGQVFQPGLLLGLPQEVDPAYIVVELGENYRYEPCRERPVTVDIRSYLLELARLWPSIPTYVLTPLWHDEQLWPSHKLSCFAKVPIFLAAHTAPHDQMVLVDGLELIDHQKACFADGFEHPNELGNAQLAERLLAKMGFVPQDVVAEVAPTKEESELEAAPEPQEESKLETAPTAEGEFTAEAAPEHQEESGVEAAPTVEGEFTAEAAPEPEPQDESGVEVAPEPEPQNMPSSAQEPTSRDILTAQIVEQVTQELKRMKQQKNS